MVYHYVTAYSIRGLRADTLSNDVRLVEVNREGLNVQAVLTPTPDRHLYLIDREVALANIMLGEGLGGKETEELSVRLSEEVAKIQADRSRKQAGHVALVVDITGSVEMDMSGPVKDYGEFIVWACPGGGEGIRLRNKGIVNAITAALALALGRSEPMDGLVSDGYDIYFRNEAGRVTYPFRLSISVAQYTISTPCTEEVVSLARTYAEALTESGGLTTTSRLLLQSLDDKTDQFRAFISAWTALEVLVNKTFKMRYRQEFVALLRGCSPAFSSDALFAHARGLMDDRYSLQDKFNIISHFLGGPSLAQDRKRFQDIKCTRDRFIHGEDIDDAYLPLYPLQSLLIKYLAAHLAG